MAEAATRALIYIRLPERSADERGYLAMQAIREMRPPGQRLPLPRLKELFTEQFLLLGLDQERAVSAIPVLLSHEAAHHRRAALTLIRRLAEASGDLTAEGASRLARIEALFSGGDTAPAKGEMADA